MSNDNITGLLTGDYPDSWDEYIGQDKAKRALQMASRAAFLRGENLDHTLVCSEAGMGKTAIVQLTIRQLDRRVHMVSGALNLAKARMMFSMVEDGDVIFYDEFHKVLDGGLKNAEWLLHYLQDGVLLTPFGQEKVPQVTIIGATTEKGILPESILSRFTIVDLEPYTDAEAASIITTMSEKVLGKAGLPTIGKEAAVALSAASLNQPRTMRKLLNAVRDLAVTEMIATPEDGDYDVAEAFEIVDVTFDGLTKDARKYLEVMYVEMRGEPTGEAVLRRRAGIVGKGLFTIEKALQDKGLTGLTKGGRMLTGPGFARCRALFPSTAF